MINSQLPFQEQVHLKDFCTYGIGGPARYFLPIRTAAQMQEAIIFCTKNDVPYFILGKGSNILFSDQGFYGAVLLNKIDFFNQPTPGTFHVGAGYSFSLLGTQTAKLGWGGLEFASGIPGSVGGAVYMNAGANGKETHEYLESVDFIDEQGDLQTLFRNDLAFSYRTSSFQKRQGAIVGATFRLYADAEARKKQMDIIGYRTKTQPYSDKSAGCVFVNPQGNYAGALIEQCGLKGYRVGGAQVSCVHANFLINASHASCSDMLSLIEHVQSQIQEKTGIELKVEVRRLAYNMGEQ